MEIEKNVSIKDKNWFCTGGAAKFYCEPKTPKELVHAINFAKDNDLRVFVLGYGANTLVSDDGVNGLVIHPQNFGIKKIEKNLVMAGAGTSIQDLIDWSLENNLIGLEEFSGIPGSIGGAVYINIHYFQFFISNFLVSAQIINKQSGEIKSVENSWFNFGYDKSKLQEKKWFLLNATFELKKSTDLKAAYAKGRRDEIIRQRNSRYPNSRTCGSFFRNFSEQELSGVINAKKLPFVAYYLDKLGIKGELRYGGAIVSTKHANMIVSESNGTSNDIVMLARKMQELVFENFGLIPQAECEFLGFDKYPLHKDIIIHQDQISSRKILSR